MNRNALIYATLIGLVLQLIMVIGGHFNAALAAQFALVGMLISLVAGLLYGRKARGGWSDSLIGGALAGGICALIGIAVSFVLGDVLAMILVVGTIGSAVAGLIGGAIAKIIP
ncbi:MAG: hypothetical protein WC729_04410 [Sphingomonas sp.]|jgi:hypothetical protein|uniref:hypothetical protein n=1 Tax=Sphingomonas sp. TaxID=28214 RepID=UPI003569AE5D